MTLSRRKTGQVALAWILQHGQQRQKLDEALAPDRIAGPRSNERVMVTIDR